MACLWAAMARPRWWGRADPEGRPRQDKLALRRSMASDVLCERSRPPPGVSRQSHLSIGFRRLDLARAAGEAQGWDALSVCGASLVVAVASPILAFFMRCPKHRTPARQPPEPAPWPHLPNQAGSRLTPPDLPAIPARWPDCGARTPRYGRSCAGRNRRGSAGAASPGPGPAYRHSARRHQAARPYRRR